jgi:ADP-heptose:LPS heptosyltransferase
MEKYIVFHCEGGLGKNVAATAILRSLKQRYEDRKIIVSASYPEVFLNLPVVDRVYKMGMTQYFYDDYIKDKDTLIFRHEPYFETNHILKKSHLIENWCKLLDIEYTGQIPVLNFNFTQQRNALKWQRDLPILVIQTNGGPLNAQNEYSWARDIPYRLAVQIAEKYKSTHHIIQVTKPTSLHIPGAEVIDKQMPAMELFSLLSVSDKRVLIDSCLQHAAAAMNLSSTVFWVGTSPKNFGYEMHNNIVANPPSGATKLVDSYLFDYSFDGVTHECPYFSLEEMFNIEEILETI